MHSHQILPDYSDPCLYNSSNPKYTSLRILEYVDDLILSGTAQDIDEFLKDLKTKYEIRDYGYPRSFIGMEITKDKNRITLTQTKYIEQMATRFKLTDSNYAGTPMEPNLNLTQ